MPEPKFPRHPTTNDTPVMKHTDIRSGSCKRSEAENDNPNVVDMKQPDDPGETIGGGPKRDAPDTAAAGITEDVERASRRQALKEAVVAGLFAGGAASAFIGALWLLVWLAG